MAHELDAELLATDPASFRAVFVATLPPATKISPAKVAHVQAIAGIYGLMILLAVGAIYIRLYRGGARLYRRSRNGAYRPNPTIFMVICLIVYSALWMGLILGQSPMDERLDRHRGMQTYKVLVFVPLSLAGWIQVYATVSAIPFQQGLVNTRADQHSPAVYESRWSRVLESAALRNTLLVVLPLVHLANLLPPAILSGKHELEIYRNADRVYPLLDEAVNSGWSIPALLECGERLIAVQTAFDKYKHYVKWCSTVYCGWLAADFAVFLPAAFTLHSVLTRQLNHFRRALINAQSVIRLDSAMNRPPLRPRGISNVSQDHLLSPDQARKRSDDQDGYRSPSSPANLSRYRGVTSTPIGDSTNATEEPTPLIQDLYRKVAQLRRRRRVFLIQALATVYAMTVAMAYSIFGIVKGYWSFPGDYIHDLPIYLPFYCFLLPVAIPSLTLTTWLLLKDASKPQPSSRLERPRTDSTHGDEAAKPPMLEREEEWELPTLDIAVDNASPTPSVQNQRLLVVGTGVHVAGSSSPSKPKPSDWVNQQ